MFTEMLSKFNIYMSEITNVLNNTVQSISAILLVVLGVILKILWDYIKENREKQRNRADCLLLIRKEAWNKIDFLGYPQFTGCLTANFEASIKHYPPCLKHYEIKKLRDIDEMILNYNGSRDLLNFQDIKSELLSQLKELETMQWVRT